MRSIYRTKRFVVALTLVILFLISTISIADAALPTSASPHTIKKIGYDSGETMSGVTFSGFESTVSNGWAIAGWGKVDKTVTGYANASRTGNTALWCAGTLNPTYHKAPAFTMTRYYPTYPSDNETVSKSVTLDLTVSPGGKTYITPYYGRVIGGTFAVLNAKNTSYAYSPITDYSLGVESDGRSYLITKGALSSGTEIKFVSQFQLVGTAGSARINLPELSDYYSSSLSFYYRMPSLGEYERLTDQGLRISFGDNSLTQAQSFTSLKSGWTSAVQNFSVVSNEVSLSRKEGWMSFGFKDIIYGKPFNGAGPTVDDIAITGYKYGPVRTVTPNAMSGGVIINWQKPVRAVGSTTEEERAIGYRLWRATAGQTNWSEITTTTIDSLSFVDRSAYTGLQFDYLIQTWGTGADSSGYGEPVYLRNVAGSVVLAEKLTTKFISPKASSTAPAYGASVTLSATLADAGGVTIPASSVKLQRQSGTSWVDVATRSTSSAGMVTHALPVSTMTKYRWYFAGTSAVYKSAESATITVKPQAKLVTPTATSAKHKKTSTITAKMLPKHEGTIKFYIEQKLESKYKTVKSARVKVKSSGSYSIATYKYKWPKKGTYYIRAYHADASHTATSSTRKKVIVR